MLSFVGEYCSFKLKIMSWDKDQEKIKEQSLRRVQGLTHRECCPQTV